MPSTNQNDRYKRAFAAYVSAHIEQESYNYLQLTGWYHHIKNKSNTVGIVATAEVLILIREGYIPVSFDCTPMLMSIMSMQQKDGGWNYRTNYTDSATLPTAYAVHALLCWKETNPQFIKSISKGIEWLISHQNKSGLWNPIGDTTKDGYFYFSSIVLQCFAYAKEILPDNELKQKVVTSIKKCCDAILNSFIDDDTQCGWGIYEKDKPTLFHTAFVVYTLLKIHKQTIDTYQIIKSLSLLQNCIQANEEQLCIPDGFIHGEIETYQEKDKRLLHFHSIDIYIALALLYDKDAFSNDYITQISTYFINRAVNVDWSYKETTTCWRMYDIIHFCNQYYRLSEETNMKKSNNVDVLIIVATVEEERAIKKHYNWTEEMIENNIVYYTYTENKTLFALARSYDMGEASAAQFSQKLIDNLHPTVITMAGFCAGKQGKVALGDLVVADKVYKYDGGKRINEQDSLPEMSNYTLDINWQQYIERADYSDIFNDNSITVPKDYHIQKLELLNALIDGSEKRADTLHDDSKYPDWKSIIDDLLNQKMIARNEDRLLITPSGKELLQEYLIKNVKIQEKPHRIHIGPIATGSQVVEWDKIFDHLEKTHERKTAALDMEAHAIGMLANNNNMHFIVVKGVGDYAKPGKSFANRYIEYVSYMSCKFIIRLFTDEKFLKYWKKND